MLIKDIWLGIGDYFQDIYHDWILGKALKMGWQVRCEGRIYNQYKPKKVWVPVYSWKEGNIIHYIQQRRWAHKNALLLQKKDI